MVDDHRLTLGRSSPAHVDATGPLDRIAAFVWWAGALLLALIALSAVLRAAQVLARIWRAGPGVAALVSVSAAAALAAVALVGLGVVVVLARRGHAASAVSIGIAALIVTRAIAIVAVPTPLRTDWAEYHRLAISLANGAAFDSARPPGWPLALSLLYRTTGPNPLVGELANLVFAVAIGLLIYIVGVRSFGRVAAAAGLFLWAISPGPALFTVVLASEPLFTLPFVAAVVAAAIAIDRTWRAWLAVGILLGLAHYVRPIGLVLIPAFVVLPFLVGVPRRRAAGAVLALLVAFALVVGPSVAWQYERFGRLTLSTSNFDGWNLLVGLNVAHGGRYNLDDRALVGAEPGTVEFRDRSYRLAIERLTADPGAVLVLAVPKFRVMWGDSTYGVAWTLASNEPSYPRITATMNLLSQVGYTAVVILAAACLWIRRRERDPVVMLIVLCLGSVALSEVFLEVQPRYHAPFEPLFCLLAGVAVGWLAERYRKRASAVATPGTPGGEPSRAGPVVTSASGSQPPLPRIGGV